MTEGAWSDAESDPHAFLYWPETRQLVLPVYGSGQVIGDRRSVEASGALVVKVGDDSLQAQGFITHAITEQPTSPEYEDYYWTAIMRSIVIGDSLYTLWNDGLQVNDLDDLDLQSWLPIESPQW